MKGGLAVATGEKHDQKYKADLGNRIIEMRKAKGLNQKELAEALNISATRLNYWEKGKSASSAFFIDQIAQALGVSVSQFLGWDEIMGFEDYLSSLGYSVSHQVTKWHNEPEEHGDCPIADESFIEIQSISTGKKYSFTSEEFDRFRLSIKQAVEFALYQSDK